MGRVRYSLKQAEAEARRLASEFFSRELEYKGMKLSSVTPHLFAPQKRASKHPTAWIAKYSPAPVANEVIDGGELLLLIDLETASVRVADYP